MKQPTHRPKNKDEHRVPVDASKLKLEGYYEIPPKYYYDLEFSCKDCGGRQVWTASQQKWWYEEAGGNFESTAVRCLECRKKEKARKQKARRIHFEGLAKKHGKTPNN
ncbi:MAG: zinc-ribbon domain-containing protein [Chromatiales bacterium]|jgi:hypothetical protein